MRLMEKKKERICGNAQELKICFIQNSTENRIKQFKHYLQELSRCTHSIKDFIMKYIFNHFYKYA